MQAAEEETKVAQMDASSVRERLQGTLRAYSSMQMSCLQQEQQQSEAAQALVTAMEGTRREAHDKIRLLTGKVRSLTLQLKEEAALREKQ